MRRQANSVAPGYVRLQINHPFLHAFSTAFTAPGYDHSWAEQQFAASHAALKTGALHDLSMPEQGSIYGLSEEERERSNADYRQKTDHFHREVARQTGLPHPEEFGEDETDEHGRTKRWVARSDLRTAWEGGIRRALTHGHIDIDQAEQRGYRGDGRETRMNPHGYRDENHGWRPMPAKLYHVGTDADAIAREGLKTRHELGHGAGLGGGTDHTVSVTSDPTLGPDIYHSLHEHHAVIRGDIPVSALHEYAKHPPVGEPFFDRMKSGMGERTMDTRLREVKTHDGMLKGDQEAPDEHPGWKPTAHVDGFPPEHKTAYQWERPMTDREKVLSRSEAYKAFSYARGNAGGHRDPLFISNDPHAFAKVDPAKFGIVHLKTHPGAQGYTLSGGDQHHPGADSGEWRTGPGSPFDVEKVDKPRPRHLDEFGLGDKTAVQAPPPGLSFTHEEFQTGGSKHPTQINLRAHTPEDGQVGALIYYPPKRRNGIVSVYNMHVEPEHRRRGIGSALMDELQRRHPDSTIDHGDRTWDGEDWWKGYTQGRTVRRGRTAGLDDDDYRMQHRPPGRDGIPIHDMTVNLPADIYTHPHYYSDMSEPSAQHAHRIINQVRGKPDARVHIYRALPAEHAHQGFRPGDWVTTSKDYARQHGTHAVDPKHDWPVIHTVVKADDLHTDGDDFREFGYNGTETKPGNVAFKGGYHQEISDRAEGGVRQVQRRQGPLTGKGYSFTAEHDHIGGTGGTIRAWHHDDYAGHMHYNADGSPEEPHIEPEHQHLAEELTRRMRMKLPPRTGAVDHEVWYHGTSAEGAEHVQRDGLTAPPGVMPSAWPMVTTSREQAARYAPSRPGSKVIEFHIPKHLTNYRNEGSVLWPADEHNVYGYAARAAGPKGTIPPSMIHAVHDVDDPSSKTASTRRKQASRVVPCTHCKGRGTFSNDKGQSWACPTCHGDKTLEQADHWDPPELPQEQREAQGAEDHRDYSAKSLQLAKNPVPGTVVWRGEFRHKDDLHRPPSVGMHWSVKPEQATALHPPTEMIPEDHRKVLWEARVDDPEKQTIPRSHPVWYGRHRSMDSEAEVRFKPGTKVHLQAAYLHDGRPGRSMLSPLNSEYSAAGWTKHPMGVEVPIEHKRNRDDGMMEYQEHFPDLFKNASMRMVRPSQVWDHIRTDVHPHRLDTIRDSVAEHGWQPDWNVADGPIKVSLDPPAVSNGSHRLHVLRELGHDEPIPMQVTAASGQVLYHGSMQRFEKGTVLTPDKRADGSIHSGDWVYATTDPESARYFASMHDTSPESDSPVHIHRVEPVGDIEPDVFLGERDKFSQGNYRAKALRVLDHHQVPGHWAKQASLSDEDRVSVAEQAMERGGHTGRSWHVPAMHRDDPAREEAQRPVHEFVNGVLSEYGRGPVRVSPKHWDLRSPGSGRALYDHTYGTIGLKGEDTNDLELLHEMAHALTGKPGHDREFVQAAHSLYQDHLGPEAAQTFRNIVEPQRHEAATTPELHRGVLLTARVDELAREHERGGMPAVHRHLHDLVTTHQQEISRSRSTDPGVGTHWTSDPGVARKFSQGWRFAGDRDSVPHTRSGYNNEVDIPIHLSGRVAPEHHVTDPDELRHHMVEGHGWEQDSIPKLLGQPLPPREQETLVRKGAPVDVTSVRAALPSHPDWVNHLRAAHDNWEHEDWGDQEHSWQTIGGPGRHQATRTTPHDRVFGPTYGLDVRLWENEKLREPIRDDIIARWRTFCLQHRYRDWSSWVKIVFFGSEASEWTGPGQIGNGDFDLSIGIEYDRFRATNPNYAQMADAEIATMFTGQMHAELNDPAHVFPDTEGTFDQTWFANLQGWSIERMRPYAAYDVIARQWIVKPPHLPDWDVSKLPVPMRRILRAAETTARNTLKLREPDRTLQAARLYDMWHADRSNAFGEQGEGWYDIGNLREKYLDQLGLWGPLAQAHHRAAELAPLQWDNTPHFAKLPKSQKCKYCKQQATHRVIHSEGMAYVPACDEHLDKAKHDAARCTPDGSVDPSNIDAVRKIAAEQIHRLPVHEFQERYRPAEYDPHGIGWDAVDRHPNFHEKNPLNPDRVHGGTWHAFVEHVRQHGIQEPVEVEHWGEGEEGEPHGEVVGGHHRVKAAEITGHDVPFVIVNQSRVHASYADYLRGGGLDQMADRVYSQPQHHVGDHWNTPQYPGTVGWVKTDEMRQMRHHDGTQNARSPEVTHHLTEGFKHGEGWLSPLQLNYAAEDHKVWLGEGNHRLEAAHRAGEEYVPVTIAHTQSGHLPSEYRAAPFTRKVNTYSEMKGLRGQSGDTIHPAHILPSHWLHPNSTLPGRTASLYHSVADELRMRNPEITDAEIEQHLRGSKIAPWFSATPGGPTEIHYIRNNGGMRKNTRPEEFGQQHEPWGRYYSENQGTVPHGWESGVVHFDNPLHVPHGAGGWKSQLSAMHDGATGKELSSRLLAAGHDGVITHDEYGTSEIVDVRPRDQRTHVPDRLASVN